MNTGRSSRHVVTKLGRVAATTVALIAVAVVGTAHASTPTDAELGYSEFASASGVSAPASQDGGFSARTAARAPSRYNRNGVAKGLLCITTPRNADDSPRDIQILDVFAAGLGLIHHPFREKDTHCSKRQTQVVTIQDPPVNDDPSGEIVYQWGTGSCDEGDGNYGESGHIRAADLGLTLSQIRQQAEAKGVLGTDAGNGGKAAPWKDPNNKPWSITLKPTYIGDPRLPGEPKQPKLDQYHTNRTGTRSIHNTFATYGTPAGASHPTKYAPLMWSWINKKRGGIIRTMIKADTPFYLANVKPEKTKSYKKGRKLKDVKKKSCGATVEKPVFRPTKNANGWVEVAYGYVIKGNERIYGWTVVRHWLRGTGKPVKHFAGRLPWPSNYVTAAAVDEDDGIPAEDIEGEPGEPEDTFDLPDDYDVDDDTTSDYYGEPQGVFNYDVFGYLGPSKTRLLGDINGDGRDDAVAFSTNGTWEVELSYGYCFCSAAGQTVWATGMGVGSKKQFLADVNGDGRDDAVMYFASSGTWAVAISTGSGFTGYQFWKTGLGVGSDNQFVGDLNGDGGADAIAFYNHAESGIPSGSWLVAPSTGISFGNTVSWAQGHGYGSQDQLVGDVTGDGLPDAVVWFASDRSWWVFTSNGQTFVPWGKWTEGFGARTTGSKRWLADVNNDGKSDVIDYDPSFQPADNSYFHVNTVLSDGTKFLDPYTWARPTFDAVADEREFNIGDVDGNGQADLVNFDTGTGALAVGLSRDETPPDTTVAEGPATDHAINADRATFEFESERLARYLCRFDGAGFGNCNSTETFGTFPLTDGNYPTWANSLADGRHTLEVAAVDVVGNVDQSPAVHEFTIDRTNPRVSVSPPLEWAWTTNELQDIYDARAADLNADGIADPLAFAKTTGQIFARVSTAQGTGTWHQWFAGDPSLAGPRILGDVNGDQRADFATVDTSGNWRVGLANADTSAFDLQSSAWTQDSTGSDYARFLADVDGDGRDDAVRYEHQSHKWWVGLSTGTAFAAATEWQLSTIAQPDSILVSDVNGDAKADVVVFEAPTGRWSVALADTAQQQFVAAAQPWASGFGIASNDQTLADVNGDGRADAIAYDSADGSWDVAQSNGSGFGNPREWINGFGSGAQQKALADIDGDGRDDAIAMYRDYKQWFAAPSTGTTFDPDDFGAYGTDRTFAINSNELLVAYECAIDGGAYAECPADYSVSGLTNGVHTLSVKARDDAGNYSSLATRSFRVDIAAPSLGIATPSGLVGDSTPRLAFWVKDDSGVASTSCSVDGGSTFACTDGQELTQLADGQHTISITAVDTLGNSSTYGPETFVVDTTAPALSVSGLTGVLYNHTDLAAVASDANGIESTQCSLNGGAASSCAYGLRELPTDGSHSVVVTAIDRAGNAASNGPRQFTFVTDHDPPTISIGQPTRWVNTASPVLGFTASDPSGVSSTKCTVDGGAEFACATGQSLASLSNGTHTLLIKAADSAKNFAVKSAQFTIDTSLPDLAILAPAGTSSTKPQLRLTGTALSKPGIDIKCSIDGGTQFDCDDLDYLPTLAAGSHSLVVTLTGPANDVTTKSVTFTVSAGVPTIVVQAPHGDVPTVQPVVTFTATDDVAIQETECAVDGEVPFDCQSGDTLLPLEPGPHRLTVFVRDGAGNTSEAIAAFTLVVPNYSVDQPNGFVRPNPVLDLRTNNPQDIGDVSCFVDSIATACANGSPIGVTVPGEHALLVIVEDQLGQPHETTSKFTVDSQAPTLTIVSPASGASSQIPWLNVDVSDNGGQDVALTCSIDSEDVFACQDGEQLLGVVNGSHSLSVTATDAAGNSVTASRSFTVSQGGPSVSISYPSSNITTHVAPTFSLVFGGWDPDNIVGYTCRIDEEAPFTCQTQQQITVPAEGLHTLLVTAQDSLGNLGAATTDFYVDTTAPTVLLSKPDGIQYSLRPRLGFHVSDLSSYGDTSCSVDGAAYFSCASSLKLPTLTEGLHTIRVRSTDDAGNVGFSQTKTFEVVKPTAFVSSPTGLVNGPPGLTYTTNLPTPVSSDSCLLDGVLAGCNNGSSMPQPSEGPHTLVVNATDQDGNVATGETQFVVDVTVPTLSVSQPQGIVTDTTPAVSYSTSDLNGVANVKCKVDSGVEAPCASGGEIGPLGNGNHSLRVTATDNAGNPKIVTVSFSVDTNIPYVYIPAPAGTVNTRTPILDVDISDASGIASVQCIVDGGTPFACSDGVALPELADGTHSLRVDATDNAGHVGSYVRSFTVEAGPPTVTISAPASGATLTSSTVDVSFSANETATFECKLDSGSYSSCASVKQYTGLANGSHTVTVKATDSAGNPGTSAVTFTVSTAEPIKINFQPSASPSYSGYLVDGGAVYANRGNGQTYGWSQDMASATRDRNAANSPDQRYDTLITMQYVSSATWEIAVANGTYQVHLVAGDPSYYDSVYKLAAEGTTVVDGTPTTSTRWIDGTQSVTVSDGRLTISGVSGATNNKVAFVEVTPGADTTPPDTTITAGPAEGSATNNATPVFSFSSSESGSTFQCKVDAGAYGSCTSSHTTSSLSEGGHTFYVRSTDGANNTDQTPAQRSFNVDVTTPTVAISAPATGSTISSTSVDATFSANETATFQCKLDSGSYSSCSSPKNYTGLSQGSHTITVQATDVAGNVNTSATTFTVSSTAPPINVNFQPSDAGSYSGYLIDSGAVYGDRGNGYSYGWSQTETSNTRLRTNTGSSDLRKNTLMHLGYTTSASWKIALANGQYSVHVLAGDPTYPGTVNLTANGTMIINGTTTSSSKWIENTLTVDVTNGFLTIAQANGVTTNNIDYIDIAPL